MTHRATHRRLVAAAAALALVAGACGGGGDGGGGDGAASGDRLPDVMLTPLSGGDEVSLRDIEGPAVINLWATWCTPCRREIPDFEAVHRERGDAVTFVGVNVGEDADRAAAFILDTGATYDQYLDPAGLVTTGLEATTMPVTVVVDAAGTVVARHMGQMGRGDLRTAIDDATGA